MRNLTLLMLLISAVSFSSEKEDESTKFVYHFHDSSVPPEYHRSYKITIEKMTINVKVDSYGDILNDKTFKSSEENFEKVVSSFYSSEFKNCELKELDGCTGGTGVTIQRYEGDNIVFSGYKYTCGGDAEGDLCGDVESFGILVKGLVPDLQKLLK